MKVLSTLLLLFTMGCSVQQKDAPNIPPDTDKLVSFASEYGSLELSSFNAFLNPEFKNENEGIAYYNKLTKFKKKIAANQADADKLTGQILEAKSHFVSECRAFAATDADFDEVEGAIRNWKQPADDNDAKLILACQKNSDDRKTWLKHQEELSLVVAGTQEDLRKFADPDYDGQNPDNYKLAKLLISLEPSKIKIRETGAVDIDLMGFCFEENNQSTKATKTTVEGAKIHDAFYDARKQMLSFVVPEVKKIDGAFALTGNAFSFSLGRGADSYGSATFSGKMKLVDSSGKLIREGRAIVGGKLNGALE